MSINVLSLFDGISCGQIALQRANIKVNNYFASEIDEKAIKVTQHHFPNTIQLGSIESIEPQNLPRIDLVIGGSPCQGFSLIGKQLNFDDARSKLFFEYVKILNEIKKINSDVYFLLENVKMRKESQDVISKSLKTQPIEINSALVSAQNRRRLYWTNIPNVTQPEDKKIYFNKILYQIAHGYYKENIFFSEKCPTLVATSYGGTKHKVIENLLLNEYVNERINEKRNGKIKLNYKWINDKIHVKKHLFLDNKEEYIVIEKNDYRILNPEECEELQTLPKGYTEMINKTARYKGIGNGWTVDVIAHIFSFLSKKFGA